MVVPDLCPPTPKTTYTTTEWIYVPCLFPQRCSESAEWLWMEYAYCGIEHYGNGSPGYECFGFISTGKVTWLSKGEYLKKLLVGE